MPSYANHPFGLDRAEDFLISTLASTIALILTIQRVRALSREDHMKPLPDDAPEPELV